MDTTVLRLLPDTPGWLLPVVVGHWHRDPDGTVVARYERGDGDGWGDELAVLYGEGDSDALCR